jgi:hypothetical protein
VEDADRHAAAVDDVDQGDAVPALRVARHEHHELAPGFDLAGGVAWCLVDVDDLAVVRVGGIEGEVDAAGEPLVGTGVAEGCPPPTSSRCSTTTRTTRAEAARGASRVASAAKTSAAACRVARRDRTERGMGEGAVNGER